MRPPLGTCLLATLLINLGCASTEPKDPDSLPADQLPVGSSFFLNEDTVVSSGFLSLGRPSIQIQFGQIVRRLSVQQFEPYCEFILNAKAQGETLISSDIFVVESVRSSLNFMRRTPVSNTLAASADFRMAANDSEGGSGGFSITLIDYSLSSADQGSNYLLRCRSVDDFATRKKFTVGDLRDTLGGIFSIQTVIGPSLDAQ